MEKGRPTIPYYRITVLINYRINKLEIRRKYATAQGQMLAECSAKIFEKHTHLYISSHIFLARLRPPRAGWRIFIFRIYRFTVARKSSWTIFGGGLSVPPPRRPREAFHCVRYDGKKRPGIGQ